MTFEERKKSHYLRIEKTIENSQPPIALYEKPKRIQYGKKEPLSVQLGALTDAKTEIQFYVTRLFLFDKTNTLKFPLQLCYLKNICCLYHSSNSIKKIQFHSRCQQLAECLIFHSFCCFINFHSIQSPQVRNTSRFNFNDQTKHKFKWR